MKQSYKKKAIFARYDDDMFVNFIFVAMGGALGSALRYGVGQLLPQSVRFAWATFVVNIVGAFIIGVMLANVSRDDPRYLFGVVGFCGAFTTFSAFSVETLKLIECGEWLLAVTYVVASVVLSVIAVVLGYLVSINN